MYAKLLRRAVDSINQGYSINNMQAKALLGAYRDARETLCERCKATDTVRFCDKCQFKE